MRVTWGCDEPAPRPVFDIGCNRCGGRNDECDSCGGLNRVAMYQCPTATLRAAPQASQVAVDLLIRAYLAYDSRQTLPVGGGWLDQSRSWAACCEIIDDERGRLEEMRRAKYEQDQRAAQARSRRPSSARVRR